MSRRLCDLAPSVRRAVLEELEPGTLVIVTYSGLRNRASASTLVGSVLGVARPITGAQSDELVLRVRGREGVELVTLSAATVVDVERWAVDLEEVTS